MRCPCTWGGRGCGRLMCGPAVVVEDVGAGPVCGCYQKFQTIQLFDNPSRSAIARATSLEWEIFYDWHFVEVVDELIELDDEGT